MECLIISAFVLLITLPSVVTAIEYNHGWSKLYDFFITKINKIFKKNYANITFKTVPNTITHQVRIFKEWLIVGLGIFGLELVVKLILKFA